MQRPSHADLAALFEQAVAQLRRGAFDDAEKTGARLLKALPGSFDALHLLGVIRLQRGRPAAALPLLEAARKADPRSPEALANHALALASLKRFAEALPLLDQAHAIDPANAETLNNRAGVLLHVGRAADALTDLDRVVARVPRHLGARLNRGNALAALGRFDEAIEAYDTVLAVAPDHPEAQVNRGNALSTLGRLEEAVAAYDRALAGRPDYVKARIGRGAALQALNRHRDALVDFDHVVALDKGNADARHNAALARLTLGDFRRGFADYEWRWQRSGMPARRSPGKPLWLGEYPLARKTILLPAEQGLGDTIQFVRYAALLAEGGARVVLQVPRELAALLARAEGVAQVVATGDPLPPFDVYCPLGSLPHALRTELAGIPAPTSYLTPDPVRVATWRMRLADSSAPRIAIAWSGRATHPNDRNRSLALAELAPLFAQERVRFFSVQHEPREADAAMLARYPQLTHLGSELRDFEDTAAILSLVDLVVCVDTSLAHLAGALGRPVWILVPFSPDWRWMLERADSPWYPSARLFRQPARGDWPSVIARAADELRALGAAPREA